MGAIRELSKKTASQYRDLLDKLFNESVPLAERIPMIEKEADSLMSKIAPGKKSFHDERTLSVLLTYKYPDTYTIYKDSFYSKFCQILSVSAREKGEKYLHYLELLPLLIEKIKADHELLQLLEKQLDELSYKDDNFLLTAQTILFKELDHPKDSVIALMAADNTGWQDDYIHQLKNKQTGIYWNSARPSGGRTVLDALADKIKKDGFFYIYFKTKKGVEYRAEMIDFAEDEKQYAEKSWPTDSHDYKVNFSDYHDEKKTAKILFLMRKMDKIPLMALERFKFAAGYQAPRQHNLQPISSIKTDESANYWLFQGNPKIFDIKAALLNNELKTWMVKNHKDKIQEGDKLILWVSGEKAGVYALGEIATDPVEMADDPAELKYYTNPDETGTTLRVILRITENLAANPILKEKIADIPELKSLKIGLQGTNFSATKNEYETLENIVKKEFIKVNNQAIPLNQIFYGPPGTGKTYQTVREAVRIANPNFNLNTDRSKIKEEYERLKNEGRIEFVTFHQSMSYEDFVEGIKPESDEDGSGTISYKIEDGIFKRICQNLLSKNYLAFEAAYDTFLNDLSKMENGLTLEKGKYQFTVYRHSNSTDLSVASDTNIKKITKLGMQYVSESGNYAGIWGIYYKAIYHYLSEHYGYKIEAESPLSNAVLIIDEINRGNVSQIFGELITLLEADKRLGQPEALEIILPYSKKRFGVPDNLYVIGTMNTADRSVEALDTALRRRFHFVEFSPFPELIAKHAPCEGKLGELDLVKLLQIINERLILLLDKDHQLGHSYFLNIDSMEDLLVIFYSKIIPLLQEYFYGDYGKIGLILGPGFVISQKWFNGKPQFADFPYQDGEDFLEKRVYSIHDYSKEKRLQLKIGPSKTTEFDFLKALKVLMREE
jgi:hypothetical protein